MSYLVTNTRRQFSRDVAHIFYKSNVSCRVLFLAEFIFIFFFFKERFQFRVLILFAEVTES